MPIVEIEMRLPKNMRVIDGYPSDECVYQLHSSLRDVAVSAGLTGDVKYVELVGLRDEDGLDRNVKSIRVKYIVEWTKKNVTQSQGILDYIERSILDILGVYDPLADVVGDLQVVLVIGGQHTRRTYNRRTGKSGEPWIDEPIRRAIEGKNPFTFD